jgi:hypothetical protein
LRAYGKNTGMEGWKRRQHFPESLSVKNFQEWSFFQASAVGYMEIMWAVTAV